MIYCTRTISVDLSTASGLEWAFGTLWVVEAWCVPQCPTYHYYFHHLESFKSLSKLLVMNESTEILIL